MSAIIGITLALLSWEEQTPGTFIDGKATYYSIRRMEEVAANRGMALDGAIGFVAMNRAGDLGRLVWIERDGDITGPYRVVDCAQNGAHYEQREDKRLIIEVSWEQAQAWGMRGPVPVRVWFQNPASDNLPIAN